MTFLLPLYQQAGLGLSPIEAGLVGLPVPLFAVLAFPVFLVAAVMGLRKSPTWTGIAPADEAEEL